MKKSFAYFEQIGITWFLVRWTILAIPLATIIGSLVAFFLWSLDELTLVRLKFPWLLAFLPAAGVLIYFLYDLAGKRTEKGNNLILDEIHEPGAGVPLRLAPLVLIATLITHLFGGSAGREGTAVQMGGSIADALAKPFRLSTQDRRTLLLCGMAAGFGAVFGTPVTGALFALEVLLLGQIIHTALLPCLIASFLADITCQYWGVGHVGYSIAPGSFLRIDPSNWLPSSLLLGKVILLGLAAGLVSACFSKLTQLVKQTSNLLVPRAWMIPMTGGLLIIGLSLIPGNSAYLGLGVWNADPSVTTISAAFSLGGAEQFSFAWKLLFTAITIGMGFKGGEVTPLFFIGATLGNTLAILLGAPIDLMAGLGFIAVFAAATNTPIACTIMGLELFGGEYFLLYAIACFIAYYFSGHTGIYSSQRMLQSKTGDL
ncbi:voltage-gated chloride channel family protein [Flavihumibacter sp. CACIAM 22H1]|uniref:voltage-gated chloride channel family protein n=1 Tax=Flavihumibacter sp. CACIAM 22H1 TaxID=1812911 RepID=UPI0007A7D269|nr:voltage-gated chloride channel family protein [Flavihumibacter sp. CACIAM 22H1]KYP15809.1 MAG: voltage-gated chloride channel protein [Flavihumibacter sp. CACIAM 22H1]